MQRPVMNPMFLQETETPASKKWTLRSFLIRIPHWIGKALLLDICFWQADRLQIEDASPIKRIALGMVYRLMSVPVFVAGMVAFLVWLGTHPPTATSILDPLTHGIQYDPVSFVSSDGARLDAWFVPMLDSRLVLDKKEQILRTKAPAVVLVHDYGASRDQMLPLVQPLHNAGYVVLVVGLRGSDGIGAKGCAFGLREYADIQAAVELLRHRSGVDSERIAVLGIGTGANAAMLAAEHDPGIAAIVLDHPLTNLDQLVAEKIHPSHPWLDWLKPLCKWTFEFTYRVDGEDLDYQRRKAALTSTPILVFDAPTGSAQCFRQAGMSQITTFLAQRMPAPQPAKPATANVEVKELK